MPKRAARAARFSASVLALVGAKPWVKSGAAGAAGASSVLFSSVVAAAGAEASPAFSSVLEAGVDSAAGSALASCALEALIVGGGMSSSS